MKLYIKEKAISIQDKFFVRNDKGDKKYEIRRKFEPAIGLKLHILDTDGKELGYIKEKNVSLRPKFCIFTNGEHTATITKRVVSMRPKYEVEELGWKIKGNLLKRDYKIIGKDGEVMNINKGLLKLSDTFVLEFSEKKHIVEALAVVVAIDYILDEK